MPSSLHLSVALPSLMSCLFASHLHPFMSHLSLLTPRSGLQASRVLGFSSLLPHCITFPLSFFLRLLRMSPLLCEIVIADQSIFTRCGHSLGSFNLPNKPSASFSPIMCVLLEEHIVLFILDMHQQWKRFPGLYLEAPAHLAYWFISWIFTHQLRFILYCILMCRQFPLWLCRAPAVYVCGCACCSVTLHNCQELSALKFIMLCGVWREQ